MKLSFENKLKKEISKFIIIISSCFLVVFFVITFINFQRIDEKKIDEVLVASKSSFSEVINHYSRLLNDSELYSSVINGETDSASLDLFLYNTSNTIDINTNLILFDLSSELIYSSFPVKETNLYMDAYNELLIGRMIKTDEIEKVNYNQYPSKHYYMIGKVIVDDGIEIGYAIFYIDSISLSYKIFNSQFDCVVTDKYNNIIIASNNRLTDEFSFLPEDKMKYRSDESIFNVTHSKLDYEELNFYVLVVARDTTTFYIQMVLLFVISAVSLIIVTHQISNRFARNNSRSIGLLAGEMGKIKESDKYRIKIHTDDEFEDLANDINDMVKRLRFSRKKNEQLLKQKNINEIKSLEAQFNPHFLYNSLDTIRYAMFLDPKIAEELILMMTKILRYSVNNKTDAVKLIDDYRYVEMYVRIHKHRLKGKISYSYTIDKECENIVVPKLFIQPLIENSIKYGFKNKDTLSINVSIIKQQNTVIIDIKDTGGGISEKKLDTITRNLNKKQNEITNTGLYNSKRKISLMYPNSIFIISSVKNKGTNVHIEFEVNNYV